MKNWKKTAALIMALGMTALGLAACETGDKDSSGLAGGNNSSQISIPDFSIPEISMPEDSSDTEVSDGENEDATSSGKEESSSEIGGDKENSSEDEKTSSGESSAESSEEVGGGDKEESSSSERPSTSDENPSDSSSEEIGGDEIIEIGGEISTVNEWEALWENVNAADNMTVYSTMKEDGENGEATVKIADGKYYEVVTEDGETYYGYKGEVDGKSYEWISYDGEAWKCEQIYQKPADYATGKVLFEGLEKVLDFTTATYDEETGAYVFVPYESMRFDVMVKDGKVVYVAMTDPTDDSHEIAYEITYGNAVVGELPELPAEEIVIGEQVDATGWEQAIENTYAQTNFTVAADAYKEDGNRILVAKGVMRVDGENRYQYTKNEVHQGNMGSVSERYAYLGKVDGILYEWTSYDNENWNCYQTEAYGDEFSIRGILSLENLDFATAKFDEETGAYLFTMEESYTSETGEIVSSTVAIEVKIVDGLLYSVEASEDGYEENYVLTYGDVSVELPPVTENGEDSDYGDDQKPVEPMGEITEDEWYKILENTYAQTRFNVEVFQDVIDANGLSISMKAEVAVGDGKGYYNAQGSYNGEAMQTSCYIGRIDGVMYEWYSEDGGDWELSESSLTEEYTTGYGIFGYYLEALDFADVVKNDGGVLLFETDEWMMTITVENELITVISVENYDPYDDYDSNSENLYIAYDKAYEIILPDEAGNQDSSGNTSTDPVIPDVDFSGIDGDLGTDIIGEEVSEAEFNKAIANTYASTNFIVTEYADYGDMIIKAIGDYADSKAFMVAEMNGVEEDGSLISYGYQYNYIGGVDGVDYMWYSEDNTNFECQVKPDYMPDHTSGKYFAQYFDVLDYAQCVYNKGANAYVMMTEDGGMIVVKIVDGYIAAYALETESSVEIFTLTYGDASVGELPPVNLGESSDEENNYESSSSSDIVVEEEKEEVIVDQDQTITIS